jgi:hypothetical protein
MQLSPTHNGLLSFLTIFPICVNAVEKWIEHQILDEPNCKWTQTQTCPLEDELFAVPLSSLLHLDDHDDDLAERKKNI